MIRVAITDTRIEPRHPSRFEKKRNIAARYPPEGVRERAAPAG
jgi:hypothetical protein